MTRRGGCTRGDIITRADLAGERWLVRRAEDHGDAVDELVIVSCGSGTQIELVRRPIAAPPAARRAVPCAICARAMVGHLWVFA